MTKVETYKAFITDQLRKGNVTRASILTKFVKKFQTTDRTFDRHWKIAQEDYANELQAIESKKRDNAIDEAKDVAKRDIMDKFERMEILTKMARGVATRIGEEIIVPSPADRRGAVDLLNKMDGLYDQKDVGNGVVININVDSMEIQSDEI